MEVVLQKYGGTSVGSTGKIKNVAQRVARLRQDKKNVVVVVSAMGDTTDELVGLARQISENPSAREYDALVSTGENVSASLLAMALIENGIPAISLTGFQAGILTESQYSKAKILNINPERVKKELELGKVVVVTGFQGINGYADITTIGRGGSDTSAVALAAALNASECDICTDVDGVYTTDPRIVKDARKLDEISYDEMLELASLGAKVLHPRAVECAKENNIILHVRSSFKDSEGTRVKEAGTMEIDRPVTGAALNEDEAIISILKVPDSPGIAGKIFSRLSESAVNVDMIIQSVEENEINNITFTVARDDINTAETVTNKVAKELGAKGVKWDESIAKLSIVGVGMISKPGIAARMFEALGRNNINIELISTSEIKISCVVAKKDGKRALKILHDEFDLHQK